jgi:hypothetical protein
MTPEFLIKQYVDTGNSIPEYQVNKLNKNLLNTYLRKRLIAQDQDDRYSLKDYEFELLPEKIKHTLINTKIEKNKILKPDEFFYFKD